LIKELNIEDMFHSYDKLCSATLYQIGIYLETLFASSLAVKYYLKSLGKSLPYIPLLEIIELNRKDGAYSILEKYQVDFSGGISLPDNQTFNALPMAVVHNKNIHNAHHDLILPAISSGIIMNIAVQCKASFVLSNNKTIEIQLLVSREREIQYKDVAFLNGSGCCNGLSLSLFELLKKLK
jgi:hypothetical protein